MYRVQGARTMLASLISGFWDFAGSFSVRVKVLGIVLGVILLLGSCVIVQGARILDDTLLHTLLHQTTAIAMDTQESFAEFYIAGDLIELQDNVNRRFDHYSNPSHNTDVAYIVVLDALGQIVSAAYNDEYSANPLPTETGSVGEAHLTVGNRVMDMSVPISDSDGTLRLGLSVDPITALTTSVVLRLFQITLVMVAFGFAAAFFLTWVLTRPILDLVKGTHQIAQGNFRYRVPRWANDEIGELSSAFNAMTADLERAEQERLERDELRDQFISGVILAQENERQRIARELHDSVSQSLTSLLVGVQNLRTAKSDSDRDLQADAIRQIISQTLDETRNLSWQLRPSALGELGLVAALERYVQEYQARYQISVDLLVVGLPDSLPPEIETTIYRIIQEGLTNVARYAKATTVSLLISGRDRGIRIIIEDNGVGFDVTSVTEKRSSLGLKGMRERAGLLGGTLEIESQPGQGTSLFIEISLPDAVIEVIKP